MVIPRNDVARSDGVDRQLREVDNLVAEVGTSERGSGNLSDVPIRNLVSLSNSVTNKRSSY